MTTTLQPKADVVGPSRGRPIGWISAAAFAISSVWFALIEMGVTQSPEPDTATDSPTGALESHYEWFATTLAQERVVTGVAVLGFASLVIAVWGLRRRVAADALGTAGALVVSLGSVGWIVGNVLQLGGHRAVGLMATHENPIETVNAIAFTVDMIDDAFELVAFAMLGAGILCLAFAARRQAGAATGWSRYTAGFAVALIALACAHGMDNGDAANLLLVVVGVVLTPGWLLWSDRLGGPVSVQSASERRLSS
jgi:hypothetical protein